MIFVCLLSRRSVARYANVDFGGYYVNCHDLQAQYPHHNAFQNPYQCCAVSQAPRQPAHCCPIPMHSDLLFSQDAFHLTGFHPSMMPNEPCDRGSRCFSGYGSAHIVAQTPCRYLPNSDEFPLQHPKTPMMTANRAAASDVLNHVVNDVHHQNQCYNSAAYDILRHQHHQQTDPRYTGTMERKAMNPIADSHIDVQKV